MKALANSTLFIAVLVLVSSAGRAEEIPRFSRGGGVIHGGNPAFAKAGADTINLMASSDDPTNNSDPRDGGLEPYFDGDFSDANGAPDWNGWTHYDITMPEEIHWTVSNYNQPDPLNHAAWCGDLAFAACDTDDPVGGYGNSWREILEFRQTVPDPLSSCLVIVTATLINDTEPGYDYTHLSVLFEGQQYTNIRTWEGKATFAVNDSVTYLSADYLDGTDIAVSFRFRSDGGWSDEDCSFPSAGACQVDDINVHLKNGIHVADYFEDFEHGGDPGNFGIWNPVPAPGVGDFARLWTGLMDLDPCATNTTAQVAFIDDDVVVPGTGGTQCIDWCYGPFGYIVNNTGGLAGPEEHIHTAIESPVMPWPAPKDAGDATYDGIILEFGVYVHENLTPDSPGMFHTWGVRSADTDGSSGGGVEDISRQIWRDRNFVYYGGPVYRRDGDDVTDLMRPGRDEVQVQLAVYELGWVWYWTGENGTPAPYFDNVTVKVFPYNGPSLTAREIDLAQDAFPERGTINESDLGTNHVRFDMARNISPAGHLRNDPGDSIIVDITPVRAGANYDGDPRLHYFLKPNPLFDPYRGSTPLVGSVGGMPTAIDKYFSGKWYFDLPDTGFLFPGDVLHYFIEGTDAIGGGGGSDPRTATLPADTTGFSTGFNDPLGYDSAFTVCALPSLRDDGSGGLDQPPILFVNDYANLGGENKWYTSLHASGFSPGRDYDPYFVNGPDSGVGNGIGGRATPGTLAGYETILYTAGDLDRYTLSNGDFGNDPGNDVGLLTTWLDSGGKNMFLTGDNLAADLEVSGFTTRTFMGGYMGVGYRGKDIRLLINNQTSPIVEAIPFNGVINNLQSWIAYGACPEINTFDAVETVAGAVRLAEFYWPHGNYSYSAATLNSVGTSRVISLPYDFMYVVDDPGTGGGVFSARTRMLMDVLGFFGHFVIVDPWPSGVPGAVPGLTFGVENFPNPFNPRTTFRYAMPRAGHLELSVYNVRGQLVKTLVDGPRPAGANQTVVWDGTDNRGAAAASGLYFFEARSGEEARLGKMMLIR